LSPPPMTLPKIVPGSLMIVVAIAVSIGGCSKSQPRRTRHPKTAPAQPAAAAAPDEEPATAAAPPARPAPAPAPAPAKEVVRVAVAPPAPAPSSAAGPSRPAPARRLFAAPAAAPAAAQAPGDQAIADQPALSRCEPGSLKGKRFSVQGVAASDVLNVRAEPTAKSAILGKLAPDATGVRGTSNRISAGGSTWQEVECGQLHGWVNERFLEREAAAP
jgi:hypothetical protein